MKCKGCLTLPCTEQYMICNIEKLGNWYEYVYKNIRSGTIKCPTLFLIEFMIEMKTCSQESISARSGTKWNWWNFSKQLSPTKKELLNTFHPFSRRRYRKVAMHKWRWEVPVYLPSTRSKNVCCFVELISYSLPNGDSNWKLEGG